MTIDRLTSLLRDWAAEPPSSKRYGGPPKSDEGGRPADEEHLDRLAARIHDAAVRDDGAAWAQGEQRRRLPSVLGGRLAFAGLGAAAALLAVCVAALLGRPPVTPAAATPADLAMVSRTELRAGARLFDEVERLFNGGLQWIANSGDDFQVGLASGDPSSEKARPFLVRVVVVSRAAGTRPWSRVWSTDIVARPNEWIEVRPEADGGTRISLWLCPLPDGAIAMDSAIRFREPIDTLCSTSDVLRPGRPAEVLSVKRENGEYRVFQMVAALTGAGSVEGVRP